MILAGEILLHDLTCFKTYDCLIKNICMNYNLNSISYT